MPRGVLFGSGRDQPTLRSKLLITRDAGLLTPKADTSEWQLWPLHS
jgi:hypothetical protein